jgi:hypothetical protein
MRLFGKLGIFCFFWKNGSSDGWSVALHGCIVHRGLAGGGSCKRTLANGIDLAGVIASCTWVQLMLQGFELRRIATPPKARGVVVRLEGPINVSTLFDEIQHDVRLLAG